MGGMDAARLARFAFVAGLLLLAGCASTQKHSRDLLQITLYDYAGAIRWNRPDAAAKWLDPDIAKIRPTALQLQRYDQVQITGYDVRGSESITPERYAQTVEIRLINKHTQAERAIVDQQIWRYDADKKQWWLTTGLPDITAR